MNTKRIDEVISELVSVSARPTEKSVTMMLQSIDEPWSYDLHFSDQELEATTELIEELNCLMQFRVSTTLFPYEGK